MLIIWNALTSVCGFDSFDAEDIDAATLTGVLSGTTTQSAQNDLLGVPLHR